MGWCVSGYIMIRLTQSFIALGDSNILKKITSPVKLSLCIDRVGIDSCNKLGTI